MQTDKLVYAVRWKERDMDEGRFSDYEILEGLNEVLRYVTARLANMQSDLLERSVSYEDEDGTNKTFGVKLPQDFVSIKGVYHTANHYRMHAASDDHVRWGSFRLSSNRIYAKGGFILQYYAAIPETAAGGEIDLPDTFFDALVKLTRLVLNNADTDTMTKAVTEEIDAIVPRRKWNNTRLKLPFYV